MNIEPKTKREKEIAKQYFDIGLTEGKELGVKEGYKLCCKETTESRNNKQLNLESLLLDFSSNCQSALSNIISKIKNRI